jgi:hypothetical protein
MQSFYGGGGAASSSRSAVPAQLGSEPTPAATSGYTAFSEPSSSAAVHSVAAGSASFYSDGFKQPKLCDPYEHDNASALATQKVTNVVTLSYLRTLSFRDWLQDIEPSGFLLSYQDALLEHYDTVEQIVKIYVVGTNFGDSAEKATLDPLFFDDVGVISPSHRAAFGAWFANAAFRKGSG